MSESVKRSGKRSADLERHISLLREAVFKHLKSCRGVLSVLLDATTLHVSAQDYPKGRRGNSNKISEKEVTKASFRAN